MWPFGKRPRRFVVECAKSIADEPSRWTMNTPCIFRHITRDDGLELVMSNTSVWLDKPINPDLTWSEKGILYKACANWPGDITLSGLISLGEGARK